MEWQVRNIETKLLITANKAIGPLLIHGPTSANWDVELDPIMMADWFNANAFAAFHTELGPKPPPLSNAVLLGGIGEYS